MKGTRPLNNNEIRLVSTCFDGIFATRNRALFMLGVSTGGRISELLSLMIGDVYQNGSAVTDLLFDRSIVKGGEVSRTVPVNIDGRQAIKALVGWHRERYKATIDHILQSAPEGTTAIEIAAKISAVTSRWSEYNQTAYQEQKRS